MATKAKQTTKSKKASKTLKRVVAAHKAEKRAKAARGFTLAKLAKFERFDFQGHQPERAVHFEMKDTPHHHQFELTLHTDGTVQIAAGCRLFDVQQALRWWNPKTYHRVLPGKNLGPIVRKENAKHRKNAAGTLELVMKAMNKAQKWVNAHVRSALAQQRAEARDAKKAQAAAPTLNRPA